MRADRLLAILLALQAHGRQSARALAQRLEVSERTIDRDLEALSIAGVPVYAIRGRGGGWELDPSYRTDLTGLTATEMRALMVAATPALLEDLGLGRAAEQAIAKVLAGLPTSRREEATRTRAYVHVDPTGWRRTEEAAPLLPRLEEALRLGRRIRFGYERADGTSVERLADPLGLVAKGSTWYLVARVENQERTYRASRLLSVELLDAPAEVPTGFDLAAFWAGSREAFVAELPRYHGTIRVAPDARARIRYGWRFARIEEAGAPDADEWQTLAVRWDTLDVAVDYVLGLGGSAIVVEPAELRERVVAGARAVLAAASGPLPT